MSEKTLYLRPHDAAEYLQLTVSTLAKMRCKGGGPNFIRAGSKVVLYDVRDLNAWMESHKFGNTSQYGMNSKEFGHAA